MNKLKYISGLVLTVAISGVFSFNVAAQRGSHGGGGGGGSRYGGGGGGFRPSNFGGGGGGFRPSSSPSFRPGNNGNFRPGNGGNIASRPSTFTPRNNNVNSRTYISVGINSRGGYGGYNNAYRSYYGGHYGGYNYYPSYRYRPIYYSPFSYAHFGPAFGFRLGILPFGYYPFYLGNDPFYYYDGIYYRPYADGGYEVTQPPLGATVKQLPSGAKATVINGQKYYELGGTFYQEQLSAKNKLEYVVVGTDGVVNTVDKSDIQQDGAPSSSNNAAPNFDQQQQQAQSQPSSKLSQLPGNSKVVVINQQKYYIAPNGVYYQEVIDGDNNVSYQAVSGNDTTPAAPNIN